MKRRLGNVTKYLNTSGTGTATLVTADANHPRLVMVSMLICYKTTGAITIEVDTGPTDYSIVHSLAMTAGGSPAHLTDHDITLRNGDLIKVTAASGTFSVSATFEDDPNRGIRNN